MAPSVAFTPEQIAKIAETLPAAPRIFAELREKLQDPNTDLDDLTKLLRTDGTLTTRVIRVANSIAYRRGDPVGSIEDALLRVGFQQVFGITSLATLAQLTEVKLHYLPLSTELLRANALMTALLMEELAPLAGCDPRTSYTAGLLGMIGKTALDVAAQRTPRFRISAYDPATDLAAWELGQFGLTSPEAGAQVLRTWKFPVEVFVAVRDQRLHQLAVDPMAGAKLLHVAAAVADQVGRGVPGETTFFLKSAAATRTALGLADEPIQDALRRANRRFEGLQNALL
jgi:HD-like signal output (HDOD) protein